MMFVPPGLMLEVPPLPVALPAPVLPVAPLLVPTLLPGVLEFAEQAKVAASTKEIEHTKEEARFSMCPM
jgi:hypothetical protein